MRPLKFYYVIFILFFSSFIIYGELRFNPVALNTKDEYLFRSGEIIADNEYNKTLFYGQRHNLDYNFKAISFYPENFYYSDKGNKLYIHNRMGLYVYDPVRKTVNPLAHYPNFANKDEYVISKLPGVSFSPDYKYVLGKVQTSSVRSDIYLIDIEKGKSDKIVTDVEIKPGELPGLWSGNSKFFVYEKAGKVFYFSIDDYKKGKLLAENWRVVGNIKLNNTRWTGDDHLIWIENNLIYKADSRQFYFRSIYKSYLRLGEIAGKIPFDFDISFDSFEYNDISKRFIIVKNNSSVFYYSFFEEVDQNPYLQLSEDKKFNKCYLFGNGSGILLIDELEKGMIKKSIFLIKKDRNIYSFIQFNPGEISDAVVNNVSINNLENQLVVNTSKGAFCYDFNSGELLWKFTGEEIIQSIFIESSEWVLGGKYITYKAVPGLNIFDPVFASSFSKAGFFKDDIGAQYNNKNYIIDKTTCIIKEYNLPDFKLYTESKTDTKRLISRQINKGFYKDGIFIKELLSGKLFMITGEPDLKYKLFQPELELGLEYYSSPSDIKYEIALAFDCIKDADGMFPILEELDRYNIKSTFFVNGVFMDVNPVITKELVYFDVECGNLFQYYVKLTDNDFLIDKNFIRQGLSANEEKFYRLSRNNFTPIWHSPDYSYNETILEYGEEAGYKFVTYNLDSLDWISIDSGGLYMSSSGLIERILKKVKPGQVIIFSTGKNNSKRDDWLFNNFDLLISELIRAGYSFTTVTDLLVKYRK